MKKRFFLTFLISSLIFGGIFYSINKLFFEDIIPIPLPGEDLGPRIKNELLVLVMGVDTDGQRTDVLILARANFDSGEVKLLSIPRDTRVPIGNKVDKINHAHAYGGPDLTVETMENFLNVDIDYYVKVNYRAVEEIVNSVGGVTVEIPERMYHNDPTDKPPLLIDFQPGTKHLDGKDAVRFLRYRGYKNADLGRVAAQQMFIKEFTKVLLQPKNILKVDKMVKTYYDYVDTNIPLSTMVKAGVNIKSLDMENMATAVVPGLGKTIDKVSYFIYDREGLDPIVEDFFGDYIK